MRALTLHQPHAALVVTGIKVIETRLWKNPHRGLLFIHAGKTYDDQLEHSPVIGSNVRSAIVGYAYLEDIFEFESFGHFGDLQNLHKARPIEKYWNPKEKQYGWRLKAAFRIAKPVPCRGWQKLWTPTPDIIQKVRIQKRSKDQW